MLVWYSLNTTLLIVPLEEQNSDPRPLLKVLEHLAFLPRGFTRGLPITQPVDYRDLVEHAQKFLPQVSDFVLLFQDLFIWARVK
jgi:hypothetical protein